MFHFSTDRLAGLDEMILKISLPQKVPTLIRNRSLHGTTRKLGKQKPPQETRTPLVDTHNPTRPSRPTSAMRLHTPSSPGEVHLLSPHDPSVPCQTILPCFRPLPPLPPASTLQLPSFLNLSSQSLDSLGDTHRSTPSLPASVSLHDSSSSAPRSHRKVTRRTKNKVFVGPQWVPAFHHPNSPYVPWSSPVRRRILSHSSHPSLSSPHIRSGAAAPEPWASSTFSQVPNMSTKERLSCSWKSFKNSIKKGVKAVMSRLGASTKSLKTHCTGQDLLRICDNIDTAFVQPPLFCDAVQTTFASERGRSPRASLASLVSSDSRTLAIWLEERRTSASCIFSNIPMEMSVGEYELVGSWLDLRHCDGEWLCGIRDCDMHTIGGSPCVVNEHPNGLCMAMPFDSADLLSVVQPSPNVPPASSPLGPFSAPSRFFSLPRLPSQSFDIHSAQEAMPAMVKKREPSLSMPGGWTYS